VASEPKLTRDELEYQYIISVILYQPPHYFYFVYFFSYVSFFEPETWNKKLETYFTVIPAKEAVS